MCSSDLLVENPVAARVNLVKTPVAARLDASVANFVGSLRTDFPAAFARRPVVFKREVLRLLDRDFFPQRPVPGRPRKACVDAACGLLKKQRQEIEDGIRPAVDWFVIARGAVPGFGKIENPYRRRMQLARLRSSVRMRERRLRECRARERPRARD